jgi:ATP/maltotriose-dependent transcriptional regulator MalT
LRYVAEQAEIDAWLDAVEHALRQADAAAARVIAALPRLRKGYGDTQAAGVARFRECLSACRERGDSGIAHAAAALDDLQKAAPAGARPVPVVTAPRSR